MMSDAGHIAERDRWIRLFNRLDAAISHHRKADRFQDDNDLTLWAARDRVLHDAAGGDRSEGAKALTSGERAELEVYRDQAKRLLMFDGGPELMSHVEMHRHHGDEPYIGCVFCRDQFCAVAERDERQDAIDTALSWLHGSAYVGGPSERDAFRKVIEVLAPFETQHCGVGERRVESPAVLPSVT